MSRKKWSLEICRDCLFYEEGTRKCKEPEGRENCEWFLEENGIQKEIPVAEKSRCDGCCYANDNPCIGICYVDVLKEWRCARGI